MFLHFLLDVSLHRNRTNQMQCGETKKYKGGKNNTTKPCNMSDKTDQDCPDKLDNCDDERTENDGADVIAHCAPKRREDGSMAKLGLIVTPIPGRIDSLSVDQTAMIIFDQRTKHRTRRQ